MLKPLLVSYNHRTRQHYSWWSNPSKQSKHVETQPRTVIKQMASLPPLWGSLRAGLKPIWQSQDGDRYGGPSSPLKLLPAGEPWGWTDTTFPLDAFGAFGHRVICLIEGKCQTSRHPGSVPWSPPILTQHMSLHCTLWLLLPFCIS